MSDDERPTIPVMKNADEITIDDLEDWPVVELPQPPEEENDARPDAMPGT